MRNGGRERRAFIYSVLLVAMMTDTHKYTNHYFERKNTCWPWQLACLQHLKACALYSLSVYTTFLTGMHGVKRKKKQPPGMGSSICVPACTPAHTAAFLFCLCVVTTFPILFYATYVHAYIKKKKNSFSRTEFCELVVNKQTCYVSNNKSNGTRKY